MADEQVGQTGTCPACGTVAQIPTLDAPAEPAARHSAAEAYSAYASPQSPPAPWDSPYGAAGYRETAAAGFEVHRNVVAVAGIVIGGLSLVWGTFCGYAALLALSGGLPAGPDPRAIAALYIAMAVFSLSAALVQLVAGVALLLKRRRARGLGILSGIVSCASVWGCCIYPFCLGFGIYSLVVLTGSTAQQSLCGPVAAEPSRRA